MYLIDVYAVDREHGTMERLAFAWECHGNAVERVHEDGHHSSAGFASSLGGALDKALFACCLVGLKVVEVAINREESDEVSNGYEGHQGLSGGVLNSGRADSARIRRAFDSGIVEEGGFREEVKREDQ